MGKYRVMDQVQETATIEIVPTSQVAAKDQRALAHWHREIFGMAGGYTWSPVHWYVLVKVDAELVSSVEIVERVGTVGGAPVKLGGIGSVMTVPRWRRRGFAETALRKADDLLRSKLKMEFGLLVCRERMASYYGKLGWRVVQNPMVFEQPGGQTSFPADTYIMVLPCCDREWPSGTIDLCGLPW